MVECICRVEETAKCCAACPDRNNCRSSCPLYGGWDAECLHADWRRQQMEKRLGFADPT